MINARSALRSAANALLLAALVGSNATAQVPAGMARIEGGRFRPLLARTADDALQLASFAIDTMPVSHASFARFVRANPEWARGRVPSELADEGYLQVLKSPLPLGVRPATQVSRFAAAAYCQARAARLPTTDEWEYVARASESDRNAAAGSAFRERALRLALAADPGSYLLGSGFRNAWGVYDLHGGINEWTLDAQRRGHDEAHAGHKAAPSCGSGSTQSDQTNDYAAFLRFSFRSALSARTTAPNLGFRCASSLPPAGR